MAESLSRQAAPVLETLKKFFVLKRQPLVAQLSALVAGADAQHEQLEGELALWQSRHTEATETYQKLVKQHQTLDAKLQESVQQYKTLYAQNQSLHQAHNTLSVEHQNLRLTADATEAKRAQLDADFSLLRARYKKAGEIHLNLVQQYQKLSAAFQELTSQHQVLRERENSLQKKHENLLVNYKKLFGLAKGTEEKRAQLDVELAALQGRLQECVDAYENLDKQHQTLQEQNQALQQAHATLTDEHQELRKQLKSAEKKCVNLETKLDALHLRHKEAVEASKTLVQAHQVDELHHAIKFKFDLIVSALSASVIEHPSLIEFRRMFNEDFMRFANSESAMDREAEATMRLQGVIDQLELLTTFSLFRDKSIIAVAGGFSSGKSSFITSFFTNPKLTLPVGIEPMTAIPTYVVSGESEEIRGYSHKGGVFDVDADTYSQISHEFIKTLGFSLKDILPFFAIETPLRELKETCFIDLPGYDAAKGDGYTEEDRSVTLEFLDQASAVIWLVAVDSNGTMPQSDIEFLHSLPFEGRPLYIVANKADVRPVSDVQEILDAFQEILEAEGILFEGISAYSAGERKEYDSRGTSLRDFLTSVDKPSSSKERLALEVDKVFHLYAEALEKAINDAKKASADLNSVKLDLSELDFGENGTDTENMIKERLNRLTSVFEVGEMKKQLDESKRINASMKAIIEKLV